MDIVVWLRSLSLGKYEAAFRENEIDETVLPSLTAEDLIGVAALGHRRKLLDAIAALRTDASGKPPSVDVATTSSAPSAHPEDRAERRQVTVMFSDLVGSTALSARMDPEDLREVISAYQKCVRETVSRFGGFVAKYMGDGVLVYFGYPQAHEDDAERAVRAGLELVAAVGALKTHAPLQTRVGIATGLVVVGDLIGSGASQEQAIVGETPNLAARLQGIAEPNSVVIAESTRKLVGNLFELDDLGPKDLKGIAGPVRGWAALRASSAEGRFEAMHSTELTDLVGRKEELDLLLRRWSKAKTGEGQVILLSGEAGIGKSRLTAALLERLANEPHTRLRYFCSPQHTDSALYPIISQMERAAEFAQGDNVHAKLDKLDTVLARSYTSRQDAAPFADMLLQSNDGRYPNLELSPQQRRQKTLEALTAQLEGLSSANPVLMIFEDAHWIDPTSLETLGRAVDRIRTLRVLLAVTYRPEFESPWIGRPHITALTLNRLGEREIAAMIDGVTGDRALPASIRQDIIERTDGIPLFVEEMTKAVLEADSEAEARHTVASVPSSAPAVPASLHASLMARLDRLGPAREVAQVGAALGREFSHALLSAVVDKPNPELRSALDRLIAAGLLFRHGAPPNATYLFKHALVQDAAYGMLLREPRRMLHARIADTLENKFADVANNQPELLARHYTEARLIEKSLELWGKAGERSLTRSALAEAIEQINRALDLIATLPGTPALRREQIKLQVAIITPLLHVKGQAAPEVRTAVERAHLLIEQSEALGELPEDPLLLFSVLYGFWVTRYVAFNGDAVVELAKQFLALAHKQIETAPIMIGHRLMGVSLLQIGQIEQARTHFKQAIALYNPAEHRSFAARFGQDVRAAILSYQSMAEWLAGYPQAAHACAKEALEYSRELNQAPTLMYALTITLVTEMLREIQRITSALADELVDLASEKHALMWKACGIMSQGQALIAEGKARVGLQTMTTGLSAFKSTGAAVLVPYFLSWLSRAYLEDDDCGQAQRCITEATALVESGGERWCETEIKRVAGEVALALGNAADAEAGFHGALAVARQQQAKSWELRAAMSLARLWRDQGKTVEARELLAPVYGWFTEGFGTRDLKEAKALLEELAV
jgi:class 3 adenylate cyclase/predicted ATPase